MAEIHAVHHRAGDRVGRRILLHRQRRAFEVQRDGGGQHLDMPQLLRRGVEQHVAVFGRTARAERLEHVLEADADLALDTPDRLLEGTGEHRIGRLDADGILQAAIGVEHRICPRSEVNPGAIDTPADAGQPKGDSIRSP